MGRRKCWALGLNRRTAPELRSAYLPAIHKSSKTCTKEGGAMLLSCRLVWSGVCLMEGRCLCVCIFVMRGLDE